MAPVAVVLAVVLAACGDDDSATTATTSPATTSPATTSPATTAPATTASPETTARATTTTAAVGGPIEPLKERATVDMVVAQAMSNLPLQYALDQGWFEDAGIDVNFEKVRGTTQDQLTRLAQGDLDIMQTTPSPALFNQINEGFDANVVASMGTEMDDRISAIWLTMLPELMADLQSVEDMKGRTIEAVAEGSVAQLLLFEAFKDAGLDPATDAEFTYRVRQGPPDLLAIAQNKAADVIAMPEPFATTFEQQGAVKRWLSAADLAPWYQPHLLAASEKLRTERPEVLAKFQEVYLQAVRAINEADGEWTPDLTETAVSWNEVPAAAIAAQGGVPFFDPNGTVSLESLQRTHDFWVEQGILKEPVELTDVVDTAALGEALSRRGEQ